MPTEKRNHSKEKHGLHPRNKHRERYDFKALITCTSELKHYVHLNDFGDESIDFFDPNAVKALNKALLKKHYGISYWDVPANYLCPPIPGRADYLHYIADVLHEDKDGLIPNGHNIKCLDIGVGANCVYPLIGNKDYGWSFVGTDTDPVAIDSAQRILNKNLGLTDKIELRRQLNPQDVFKGIIRKKEFFDITICNPPFHSSLAEAQSGTIRKLKNLQHNKVGKPVLNFGGQASELWCEGGEEKFVENMIYQSKFFSENCLWFSTLVSRESHLYSINKKLAKRGVVVVKTIEMNQGNKISRLVAWTFLTSEQRKTWRETRWGN